MWNTFVKLIDEDLKPPEIILESSNEEGYGEDETIYRVAPAAVASSSRGHSRPWLRAAEAPPVPFRLRAAATSRRLMWQRRGCCNADTIRRQLLE